MTLEILSVAALSFVVGEPKEVKVARALMPGTLDMLPLFLVSWHIK